MDDHHLAWQSRITRDPAILAGKPAVKGTRLAVEFILELLEQGWEPAEIVRHHRNLTVDDVRACVAYARQLVLAEPR